MRNISIILFAVMGFMIPPLSASALIFDVSATPIGGGLFEAAIGFDQSYTSGYAGPLSFSIRDPQGRLLTQVDFSLIADDSALSGQQTFRINTDGFSFCCSEQEPLIETFFENSPSGLALDIDFSRPVTLIDFDIHDLDGGTNGESGTLSLADQDGILVNSVALIETRDTTGTQTVNQAGVSTASLTFFSPDESSGVVGLDNFRFTVKAAAIPAIGAWLLIPTALLKVIAGLRRPRQS